jgi:VanZ family protein
VPQAFYRVLCWFVLLLSTFGFLAELSGHRIGVGVANLDKLAHFLIFLVLSWLFFKGFRPVFWKLLLFLGIYGALIEVVQEYFTRRHGDVWDWVADMAGVLTFYLGRKLWHLWRPRSRSAA